MSFRSASTSRSRWYTSVSRKRCTNVRKKWNGSTMQTPAYRLENGSLPIDMNTRPCWFVLLRLLSIPHSGLWVRVRWLSSFPRAPFSAVLGYWWQRSCTDFASSSSSQCKSWTGEFVIDASLPVFIFNVHGIDALIPAVTPDWAEVLLYGHPILPAECSPLAHHGLLRGLVHAPDM